MNFWLAHFVQYSKASKGNNQPARLGAWHCDKETGVGMFYWKCGIFWTPSNVLWIKQNPGGVATHCQVVPSANNSHFFKQFSNCAQGKWYKFSVQDLCPFPEADPDSYDGTHSYTFILFFEHT